MTTTNSTPAQPPQVSLTPRFISTQQPRPASPRVGPIDTLPIREVLTRLPELSTWSDLPGVEMPARLRAAERLLAWPADRPGTGWQERWNSCETAPGPLS